MMGWQVREGSLCTIMRHMEEGREASVQMQGSSFCSQIGGSGCWEMHRAGEKCVCMPRERHVSKFGDGCVKSGCALGGS